MFTLRRITSEGLESNQIIGDSYNLINQERNQKQYQETLEMHFQIKEDKDIYGFIVCKNGTKIMPLYRKNTYFVMISNGETFANVTLR